MFPRAIRRKDSKAATEAIQDLLDQLEASKQRPVARLERTPMAPVSSLRGWKRCHPTRAQKTFDAEGEVLAHAVTRSFRIRNEAIKSLCSSVRRFRDAAIKEDCKSDYPQALQALRKALHRAEDLIQNCA